MSKHLEPHVLLEWARDIGKTFPFLDFHVHPFDVLTGDTAYCRNEHIEGLFSKGASVYHAPVVDDKVESTSYTSFTRNTERSFLLASRLKYAHTGSKVIADQLSAAGLTGALLLPVARVPGGAEELLEASHRTLQNDNCIYASCPFPIGVPADKLSEFFCAARENYGVRAIKIHPNLAGINPLTLNGRDLIEATLEVAGRLGLLVIVHGGRTLAVRPSEAEEFGMLSRLEAINWSLSSAPVILAHAGCYDLTEDEANTALSRLDGLFHKHPNLMADTSSLELFTLHLVLRKVSRDRLVFGSDALYVPVWKAWLRFLRAVEDVSLSPDNDLVQIASLNPIRCLGIRSTH